MKGLNGFFSSERQDWRTPDWIFWKLNQEFDFVLDAAADHINKKCPAYFTEKENSLVQNWAEYKRVFVNPPYGKKIGDFVQKGYLESQNGCLVVMLLPVRTDARWFHDWILNKAKELRFIKGRLKFSGHKNSAPFPSMIVVFDGRENG